jgi:arylsulfatase A-like enzyme
MISPRVLRIAPAAALAALLAGVSGCGSSPPPGPPTILLVSIDTLRADRLGAYGRANAGTPVIDRLAAEGVRFDRAQATAPVTLPSHASMLTGRSLPAHGVYDNGAYALPDEIPTLAESLASAGFKTGAFVSSPVLSRRFGLARGFTEYDDRMQHTQKLVQWDARSGADTVSKALAWFALQGPVPAFAWVHLFEPHRPYAPPEPFASQHRGDPYQGEVAAADAAVGQLLEGVRALGRARNLLVVLVADHGEGLGDHGEATHALFLYETTMRVPLVIWGPDLGVVAGKVVQGAVSVADLAPTLIEFAGAKPLPALDALSLAAVARGTAEASSERGVFAEAHTPAIAYGWSGLRAMVRGNEKLIEAPTTRLFDLASDPGELTNLAPERPDAVRDGKGALDGLMRRALAIAPAPGAATGAVSADDREALRGLGYAAGFSAGDSRTLVDATRVDPHDRVQFLDRFDRAVTLTQKGEARESASILTELAAADPGNRAVQFELGQALILAGDEAEARALFERFVVSFPESSLGWFRLGQLLDHGGDPAGAERAWRRAAEVDPQQVDALKALAALLAEKGRTAEAIETAEEAQRRAPDDAAIRRSLERWTALQAPPGAGRAPRE